jgi:hypothetical protein
MQPQTSLSFWGNDCRQLVEQRGPMPEENSAYELSEPDNAD